MQFCDVEDKEDQAYIRAKSSSRARQVQANAISLWQLCSLDCLCNNQSSCTAFSDSHKIHLGPRKKMLPESIEWKLIAYVPSSAICLTTLLGFVRMESFEILTPRCVGRTTGNPSFPKSQPLSDDALLITMMGVRWDRYWTPGPWFSVLSQALWNHSSSEKRQPAVLCYSLAGRKMATQECFWRVAEPCSSCRLHGRVAKAGTLRQSDPAWISAPSRLKCWCLVNGMYVTDKLRLQKSLRKV